MDLSDLDIAFKVERSIRREPNKAEIKVWNLSASTRARVERGGIVILRAGFENPSTLFRGDTRSVYTEREGPDVITTITARDGGRAYSDTRISRSYGAGTTVVTVLRDVVEAMGIGQGNLSDFAAVALRNGSSTFADGFVAAGPARRVLSSILRGQGLRWSVQNGALQIQRGQNALQVQSVVLASDTGMVESPQWDEKGQRLGARVGVLTVKSLIQPGLEPGRKVFVQAERVTGDFEVRKVVYTGETRGNDWYATMELRVLR